MKKVLLSVLFIVTFGGSLFGFEAGQLSLDTPNVLNQFEGSFAIRHRFYGEYNDLEKFLGTDDGGNMHFILKFALLDNLVIGVDHTREDSAYGVGVEYAYHLPFIKSSIRANSFVLNKGFGVYQSSYMLNAAFQTPNIFEHIIATANIGYDAYYQHYIAGVGVDINFMNFIPVVLTYTERIALLFEYYPQVDKVAGASGEYDAYALGVKFQTFGHHFELLATNAISMDPRSLSMGTDSQKLHFGFNINRKF